MASPACPKAGARPRSPRKRSGCFGMIFTPRYSPLTTRQRRTMRQSWARAAVPDATLTLVGLGLNKLR